MSKTLLLSDEEWARLAAVPPEEKEKALKKLARWITYEIVLYIAVLIWTTIHSHTLRWAAMQ